MIYPLGYTSKKRYKSHAQYKKMARNKVLYVCSIEASGFKIVADDGYEWTGDDCWEKFSDSVGCGDDYKSFEEFAGLTHPVIIKMIEKLGDISNFTGYISYEKRADVK